MTANQYGLGAMWVRNCRWRLDGCALGDPIGMAFVNMVNGQVWANDRSRCLALMGDPTLRPLIIKGPTAASVVDQAGTVARVSWSGGESAMAHVYRGASVDGPFTRLTTAGPATSSFDDPSRSNSELVYMIREVSSLQTGCGQAQVLSQGFMTFRSL